MFKFSFHAAMVIAALPMLLLPRVEAQAADSYPSRPITLVVPFAPGGATDLFARMLGAELSRSLGQPVVSENKPGAGGSMAAGMVAAAAPDGYTIFWGTLGTLGVNPVLYEKISYDPIRSFEAVAMLVEIPHLVVVNPAFPARTIPELIDYAKANPRKLLMASAGIGSGIHLAGELFNHMAGTEMTHVPYKGSAPAVTDLIGGNVQVMFDSLPSAMPQVKSGALRALGITANQPIAQLPGVPTVGSTLPGYVMKSWGGAYVPAGTPRAIVDRLNVELNKALASEEIRKRYADIGAQVELMTARQFQDFSNNEVGRWAQIVKSSGIAAK